MHSTISLDKKQKWLKVLEYSLPALIAIFVYVFAMLCKGIAPFGKESICYIDCSDGLIPAYTGLWDWLHGKGSFMVSFNLGAGGSLFASFVTNGFFSPISWIIGIFKRESIIYGISLLFIIRLALMATTAYICFKKLFPKINKWTLLLFSIIWTFSGWTMIHFTNIGWLDIMTLFPLLIICAKRLVEDGKIFWFILTLSYMLILSYYITYMVLVGTVLVATIYIFTACEKAKRKKVASQLFYAIFISLLISFVTFIPSCVISLGGHRFTDTVASEKTELYSWFFSKLVVIIMYALPVVFFSRLMCKYKQDKKNVLFFMLSFVVCGAGLIIEPINKMWHTGSYFCFPLRYGFILIMIMIMASLYYIDKYLKADQLAGRVLPENKKLAGIVEETNAQGEDAKTAEPVAVKKTKKKYFDPTKSLLPVFIGAMLLMLIEIMCLGVSFDVIRAIGFKTFLYFFALFAFSYVAIELALRVKTEKLTFANIKGGVLVFVVCAVQVVMLMVGYLGSSYVGSFDTTSRVQNSFLVDTSTLETGYKLKDRDKLYNYNFPYLMDYASMSTWIHISSEEQYQAYHKLGYNTASTILYSSGGTYMTDLLLANKYVLTQDTLDSDYYTFIKDFDYVNKESGEKEVVHLYELALEVKQGFTTSVDLESLLKEKEDIIEIQNIIYKAIFSQTSDILTKTSVGIEKVTVEGNEDYTEKYVLTVNSARGKNLYLNLKLSGLEMQMAGSQNPINALNGLNDFGVISFDGDATIEIPLTSSNMAVLNGLSQSEILNALEFANFDIATFKNVYQNSFVTGSVTVQTEKDTVNVSVENTAGHKYVFVPYINLANMNATVNKESAVVNNAFENFMVVELQEGENTISISYEPKLLKICTIITILALVIFAIFSVLNHFFKLSEKKFVIWTGIVGACVILFAVGFLVYLKPFFNTFVILFG